MLTLKLRTEQGTLVQVGRIKLKIVQAIGIVSCAGIIIVLVQLIEQVLEGYFGPSFDITDIGHRSSIGLVPVLYIFQIKNNITIGFVESFLSIVDQHGISVVDRKQGSELTSVFETVCLGVGKVEILDGSSCCCLLLINIAPEQTSQLQLLVHSRCILAQCSVSLCSRGKTIREVSCSIIETKPVKRISWVAGEIFKGRLCIVTKAKTN